MSELRDLLRSAGLWIAAGVTLRHLVGAWNLRRNLRWLRASEAMGDRGADNPCPVIHFVIPVLREQEYVADAITWFCGLIQHLPESTLTMVTTAREDRERELTMQKIATTRGLLTAADFPQLSAAELEALNAARNRTEGRQGTSSVDPVAILEQFPTTQQVVAGIVGQARKHGNRVFHAHYDGDGRKGAQVNHAVTSLRGRLVDDHYIAVYDVDSRPDLPLLHRTIAFINERRKIDGEPPPVVQQSATFAVPKLPEQGWEYRLCRGAALSQTLWTLRREVTSFRRYSKAVRTLTGNATVDALRRGLAQTVGHGLLVRVDVFRRLGGLPTISVLDDLPFGYRLTVAGVSVDCIPAMAEVPAPHEIRELVAQGKRWYHNYLDYPAVAAQARAEGYGMPVEHAIALGVAAYRGLTWLASSPATAACLVLAVWPRTRLPVRLLAIAGLWTGVVTPVRMLAKHDPRRKADGFTVASESVELLAAYLIRSVGPIAAVSSLVARRTSELSPKTTRRITKEQR